MALAAKARGLKYIAMTDHSKRVTMVNGLDETRIRQQWEEIDQLNERLTGITVLKGVEVDILERGGLDLSDDVLKEADWVNASIHYGQNQSREQITRRVVDALQNPYVRAFAHPTGRMLTQRKPYEIDLSAVIRVAREHGKALELNAHPLRLDLDDVACAEAKESGRVDRDFHRLAPARGPCRHALRHLAGPPRRLDQGRRAQHPDLAAGQEAAGAAALTQVLDAWQDFLADRRHRGTGILPVANFTGDPATPGRQPVPRALPESLATHSP